jgi:hypothetical protein
MAKLMQKEIAQRRQLNTRQQGVSQPPTVMVGPSTCATTAPSTSSPTNPMAQATSGSGPTATQSFRQPTNIFRQIEDVRRRHKRTKINTRLVLDEVK